MPVRQALLGVYQLITLNILSPWAFIIPSYIRTYWKGDFIKYQLLGEKIMQRNPKDRILKRISRSKKTVFLRGDFKDLGTYNQVGCALRQLVRTEKIAKLGYGLYVKIRPSVIWKGERFLATEGGFLGASREALDRLGVKWRPSDAEIAYNEGRSTQIPATGYVIIQGHFNRKIYFRNLELPYETRAYL
jgi:hypothetical protein